MPNLQATPSKIKCACFTCKFFKAGANRNCRNWSPYTHCGFINVVITNLAQYPKYGESQRNFPIHSLIAFMYDPRADTSS